MVIIPSVLASMLVTLTVVHRSVSSNETSSAINEGLERRRNLNPLDLENQSFHISKSASAGSGDLNKINKRDYASLTRDKNENSTNKYFHNLLGYCLLFKISQENCNCSRLSRRSFSYKQFCNREDDDNAIITELECSLARKIRNKASIGISTIGIIGNLLVVAVTAYHRNRMFPSRRIIGMLALSDLTFCVLQLVIYFPGLWTCRWVYRAAMCKILYSSSHASCMTSLGFIMIIAFERFNGIVNPFKTPISMRKIHGFSLMNVLCAIAFSLPLLVILDVKDTGDCNERLSNTSQSMAYNWIIFLGTFIVPVVVTSVFYALIVKSLYCSSSSETGNRIGKQQRYRRRKEDRRVTSLIVYLIVCFVVLVAPNRLLILMHAHDLFRNVNSYHFNFIQLAAILPYAIHASINPLIYSVIDQKFRKNDRLLFYKLTNQEKKVFKIVNSQKHTLGIPLSEGLHRDSSSIISDV